MPIHASKRMFILMTIRVPIHMSIPNMSVHVSIHVSMRMTLQMSQDAPTHMSTVGG